MQTPEIIALTNRGVKPRRSGRGYKPRSSYPETNYNKAIGNDIDVCACPTSTGFVS